MNLQAVGQAPSDPNDELNLAISAVEQLRETLKKQRRAFNINDRAQLNTEIANAWMISTEIDTRLRDAQKRIAQMNGANSTPTG